MEELDVSKHSSISERELRLIEQRGLSKGKKFLRRFTVFLPAIFLLLHLLEHLYYPSYKSTKSFGPSVTYTRFIELLLFGLVIWIAVSFFSYRAWEKLRHQSALLVMIVLLLTAYDMATLKLGYLKLPYFPWVGKVFDAMVSDKAKLRECVYHSFKLLFTGYFWGVGIGLVCGILSGWSKIVQYWIQPITRVLGAIPSTTYMPIVILLAKSLFGGAAFLIGLGVWFPVTTSTMNGVQSVPKHYYEAAETLGTSKFGILRRVVIPASMPSIFTGLTQGMSIACLTLVVAEMMGVEAGLGWYINWQKGWGDFTKMYGAIILICLTFILVNTVLGLIRKRVLRWEDGGI